jgi:hypothetical protein
MTSDEYPDPPSVLRAGGEVLPGHTGPLEYRPERCEAVDDAGEQSCRVLPTWRVLAPCTTPGCTGECSFCCPERPRWLICQPHLGVAVMLADEVYGSPIEVRRHGV